MKIPVAIMILFLAVALAGCGKKPAAVVNGEKISAEALDKRVQMRLKAQRAGGARVDEAELRSAVLELMVADALLRQGAKEAGIAVPEEDVLRNVDRIRRSIGDARFQQWLTAKSLTPEELSNLTRTRLMKEKLADSLVSKGDVTEEETRAFYESNPAAFAVPETMQLRFIQVAPREEADGLMKTLKAGKEDFDALADRLLKEQKAMVSGYAWASPGMFSPEISEGLRAIKTGSFGGPFGGKGGYFIFRVKDRKKAAQKSFEEAREEAGAGVLRQKRAEALLTWVSEKKKTSDIKIY